MKNVCIVIGSRANYASIKSAMFAIKDHPDLKLQLVASASAILYRYGSVDRLIEADGFDIDFRVTMLIEGETPSTMAKSTGLGLIEISSVFEQLRPDIVLTVGDRFETMSTTLAAAYMNIPIAHTMGGEVSGTIDESIRHAVTKFAHIHFPASQDAYDRIQKLGEDPNHIHLVGCPRIDLVASILKQNIELDTLFSKGVGESIDLDKPFLLVSQHPVTTEYGTGEQQILETLQAVKEVNLPALILWPNSDAGSDDISRGIRRWRETQGSSYLHFFKNLPIDIYITLMKKTVCLVGNSSSGIREGAFIGTPVVNIGSRQSGRERSVNVLDVPPSASEIASAIKTQLVHGPYPSDNIYGDGTSGSKIANVISSYNDIPVQKMITY